MISLTARTAGAKPANIADSIAPGIPTKAKYQQKS
jgi:hypothetical protein